MERARRLFETLLENRANANNEKHDGLTSLMVAAQQGSVQVELLLATGADVNKAAKVVQTPFFLTSRNHKDVVVTLLAAGADKRAEWQGWTAHPLRPP